MNTVLIPCWRRPEFLHHCLANITAAETAEEHHYIFRVDTDFDPQILNVIASFPFDKEIAYTPKTPYTITKQSFSVLTGWQMAAEKSDGLVFLIEEDVMIGTDFFRWHENAQQYAVASIAVRNPNRNVPTGGTDEFYTTTNDYCSLGVCLHKQLIATAIARHINDNYFRDPLTYCQRKLQPTAIGKHFVEQDELIRRILWNEPIAYPYCENNDPLAGVALRGPRAFHAGFYGYNRGRNMGGTFEQKVAQVAKVIYSDNAMRNFAEGGYYQDSRPAELCLPKWTDLKHRPLP